MSDRPIVDYKAIADALDDGEMFMIQGLCRHFWRKHYPVMTDFGDPIPKEGEPIPDRIKLPTVVQFCEKCIDRINRGDQRMIVAYSLDKEAKAWAVRNLYTKDFIGHMPIVIERRGYV